MCTSIEQTLNAKTVKQFRESSVMSKLMRSVNLNVENYLKYISVKGILVKD